jgi:hypothetical protein
VILPLTGQGQGKVKSVGGTQLAGRGFCRPGHFVAGANRHQARQEGNVGNLYLQKNPSSMWGWGQLWGHLFKTELTFIFVIISLWIVFGSD